jgi:uncharacterized membrane protein YesL
MGFRWYLRLMMCILALIFGVYYLTLDHPSAFPLLAVGGLLALITIWQFLRRNK